MFLFGITDSLKMSTIDQSQIYASDEFKAMLDNMICRICLDLPVEIFRCNTSEISCNNTYCEPCALSVINNPLAANRKCSYCGKENFEITPLEICRQVKIVLDEVSICCINRPLGCLFQTYYKTTDQLFYHQSQLCSFKPDTIAICGSEECEFSGPLAMLSSHNCLVETKKILQEELQKKNLEFDQHLITQREKYEKKLMDLKNRISKSKKDKIVDLISKHENEIVKMKIDHQIQLNVIRNNHENDLEIIQEQFKNDQNKLKKENIEVMEASNARVTIIFTEQMKSQQIEADSLKIKLQNQSLERNSLKEELETVKRSCHDNLKQKEAIRDQISYKKKKIAMENDNLKQLMISNEKKIVSLQESMKKMKDSSIDSKDRNDSNKSKRKDDRHKNGMKKEYDRRDFQSNSKRRRQ